MLKSELQPGTDYALRERREIGAPLQRVRIIEHIRKNKWKAQWIEPNPGLLDYVESGQLIVPWKERKAFLREEESVERLRNHNRALGYEDDSPLAKALYEIFENVGDDISFYRGVLRGSQEALARVKTRAQVLAPKFIQRPTPTFRTLIERENCICRSMKLLNSLGNSAQRSPQRFLPQLKAPNENGPKRLDDLAKNTW